MKRVLCFAILLALPSACKPRTYNAEMLSVVVSEAPIDPTKLVVAAVVRDQNHATLSVMEQTDKIPCWSQDAGTPPLITPANPKIFAKSCARATDSNGWAIKCGEQELNVNFHLILEMEKGGIGLYAKFGDNSDGWRTRVGSTAALPADFTPKFVKIELDPGWIIGRKVMSKKSKGYYFSNKTCQAP